MDYVCVPSIAHQFITVWAVKEGVGEMLGGVRWCPTEQKGLSLVNQAGLLNCIERNHLACGSCCRSMRFHRCR